MTIFVLIGSVLKVIWEMFYGSIFINSMLLLLLLVTFVKGFRLELMYITLIVNIRPILNYLTRGFELLVLLSYFVEITFFVCTSQINLLNLKEISDRLVIVAKGFLKLPTLHMLIKRKSPSLPKNLAVGTFDKLLLVFSTKVNFL